MNRILSVMRAELLTWHTSFLWPVAILGSSFAINLALFTAIGDQLPDGQSTGGIASIYVFQFIVAWAGLQQYFGFTVGLNVTRRTFYAATAAVVLLQSVVYGVGLYLMELVEHATNGWGIKLSFFDPLPVTDGNSPLNIAVYTVPLVFLSFLGLFLGVVTTRWGSNGMLGLLLITTIVAGGLALLVTWLDGWSAVGSWLTAQSGLSIVALWPLVLIAGCAAGAYTLLRRAVP